MDSVSSSVPHKDSNQKCSPVAVPFVSVHRDYTVSRDLIIFRWRWGAVTYTKKSWIPAHAPPWCSKELPQRRRTENDCYRNVYFHSTTNILQSTGFGGFVRACAASHVGRQPWLNSAGVYGHLTQRHHSVKYEAHAHFHHDTLTYPRIKQMSLSRRWLTPVIFLISKSLLTRYFHFSQTTPFLRNLPRRWHVPCLCLCPWWGI